MIYKNNVESEKKFFKRYYLTTGIPMLVFLPLFFLLLNFSFDSRSDLADAKWIVYLSFIITVVFMMILYFICVKIQKKNYKNYKLEISEEEIISGNNKYQKCIKMTDLAKIDFIKNDKIVIWDVNVNCIVITSFVDGFSEIEDLLKSKVIKEENVKLLKKNRIIKIIKNPRFILYVVLVLMGLLKILRIFTCIKYFASYCHK